MEKPATNNKLKNKILKLLPKLISFQNKPFSPRRDNRPDVNAHRPPRAHHNKAFSGPMVSMIPAEARLRKPKNFETQAEPTSPKVSCTGRVNYHKSKISSKKKPVSLPKEFKPVSHSEPLKSERAGPIKKKKKKKAGVKKFLRGGRKIDEPAGRAEPDGGSAPSLSHMRRFASSRDAFANFDWTTAQIAPEDCSDDEEKAYSDGEYDGVPFSAPILMAGGGGGLDLEPKKEINIWKRRTMAQPRSLELEHGCIEKIN